MHFAHKLPAVIFIVVVLFLHIKYIHTSIQQCSEQQQQQQQNVNMAVNACENFFDYACSNWHMPYTLTVLKAHDAFTASSADNKLKLLEYFETTMRGGNTTENATTTTTTTDGINNEQHLYVRTFYASCVQNTQEKQHTALENYLSALKQKNTTSNLPLSLSKYFQQTKTRISDTYNDDTMVEWWKTAAELRLWGVQSFWQLLVRSDWQSADKKIFYLIPLNFVHLEGMMEEKLFLQERYLKYLLLDLGLQVRKAVNLATELMRFEVSLIQLDNSEQSMILHAPQTLEYWSAQIPQLHLMEYFQILLKDMPAELQADKVLLVADLVYLRKLQTFLATKPQSFLEIFMLLKYLAHFQVHQHVDDNNSVDYTLFCLTQIETFMPVPLTQLFLELISNNSTLYLAQREYVLNELFEQLKSQFEILLNSTEIFERDAISKVLGMEKLRSMRLILPQWKHLNDKIDYNLTAEYSKNMLQLWHIRTQQELQQLLYTSNTYDDSNAYSPLAVKAFYRLQKNAIELPVGLLGPPFYDNCSTPAQFYGRLVFIMAHELLHGFDFDGLNYDKSGSVSFGWGPKSIIKYSSKAGCYMNERYKNAALHLNENIADTEGLRLAFETLKAKWLQSSSENSTTHIVDFHKKDVQLFFLSFAQTWCGTQSSTGDIHAKHSDRVNNAVANFPEFSKYFNCQNDTLLNPKDKCRIW